jgi:outer membrane lipoprotein-sorting protein
MSFKAKTIYVVVTSVFLVAFAIPLVGLTQKGSLQDLLARVDARLLSLQSLSASFEQTREIKINGEKIQAKGRLYLKKPKEILLEYTEPERQKLLVKNSVVMLYLPSLNQIQRFDLGASKEGQDLFIFWEPLGNLEKRFTIAPSRQKDSRFRYVELVPKDETMGFRKLILGLDTDLLLPRVIEVEEAGGDVVRMVLSNVKINPGFSQSLFELNVGKGVEIIDYSEKVNESPSSTAKSLQ